MDSLLANYASSDDEVENHHQPPPQPPSSASTPQRSEFSEPSSSRSSPFFSSLPPPKSSSLFQSLPQPKQSSQPSLPTGFFDRDKKEDLEEVDSISASKFGAGSINPSSLFSSLPRAKSNLTNSSTSRSSYRFDGDGDGGGNLTKPVSMFSSLPQPNSEMLQKHKSNLSSSESQPKRVVLFKPPVNSSLLKLGEDEDDDDDEEEERRRRKASQSLFQTPTVTSFLSSIPAPRNSATLGVVSSSGSGRRSILETDVSVSSSDDSYVVNDSGSTQKIDHGPENYDSVVNYSSGVEQNVANHRENYENAATYNLGTEQNTWNYASYDSYGNYPYSVDQNVVGELQPVSSANNAGDFGSYGDYGDYMQYGSDPAGQPAMVDTEIAVRIPEKRRRNEIPSEILEVKQDELIKNRPRQDQVKLTGIAFGPSHQPASTKGKPSKLHKRKHQITSLYYDMKQKEMELAERRARGLLTKAETQAKYGW